ncbi:hypothetical protein AVEN_237292-1 [Araneus ventricosus]|uniref:Uncharacterized protein n=1 Tax=Araneus ventricosus TaxID=182803 RepID=A0A4Y2DNA9_ARAVE|nr:hypothetical protein AVEN_237292-1 [Araneus ventricosus]
MLQLPSVSLCPTNWIREVIFFPQHGPFPAYLRRFTCLTAIIAAVVEFCTALHYAAECIFAVSWYMRKPVPNFEQQWLKRVAHNLVSKHIIRGIVKFISENRDLFLASLAVNIPAS